MPVSDWERRQRDSERLWVKIRLRIDELERGKAVAHAAPDLAAVWRQRALELSRSAEREQEESERIMAVVFRLGGDRYAARINAIREIQKVGRVTPVSTAPPFVIGVVNLRGSLLSVLDLRVFFGLEKAGANGGARILVAEAQEMVLGLLVDQVDEIVDVPAREVKPPLSTTKGSTEDFVVGIVALPAGMVVLLDLEKVLRNPRIVVDETV